MARSSPWQGSGEGVRPIDYLKITEITTWPFGSRPTYRAKMIVFGAVGVSFVIVPRDKKYPFISSDTVRLERIPDPENDIHRVIQEARAGALDQHGPFSS